MEKNQHSTAFWLALLASLSFAAACSQAEQKKKKGDKESAEESDDEGGDDKKGGDETEEGGDDLPDLGEGESEGDDGDAADKLNADCGGKGISDQDPSKVVYEKTINGRTSKVASGFKIVAATEVEIKVTGEETAQDSTVKIESLTKASGTETVLDAFIKSIAQGIATNSAKDSSGLTTYTNVPFKEYPDLSKDKQWDGVLCTFVPATKVVNERGGKKTVATFDPPLPASVSPKAVAERYKEEIGEDRTFKNIKVKIVESDNPALRDVDTLEMTVKVEKVDASTEVDVADSKKSIKADIAYKVTYDTGDAKKTFALGIPPVVTYYISHSKRDLVANTVDTSEIGDTGAVVTFFHDK